MTQDFGIIYIIRNKENNKKYIGQTIQTAEVRFQQHVQSAYNDSKRTYNNCLSRAIRKYGQDAFEIAVLAENVERDMLDVVEAHYIDMYRTTREDFGYNMSVGHNDNSYADTIKESIPDEGYDDASAVVLDSITDDDVDAFLRGL